MHFLRNIVYFLTVVFCALVRVACQHQSASTRAPAQQQQQQQIEAGNTSQQPAASTNEKYRISIIWQGVF